MAEIFIYGDGRGAQGISMWLNAIANATKEGTRRALGGTAFEFAQEISKEILDTKPYEPIDTGKMLQSPKVTRRGDEYEVRMGVPQAVFMEWGTKPHRPPLAPILAWARRKKPGLGERQVRNFAWAVREAINERGLRPRGFIKRAHAKLPAILHKWCAAEVFRGIRSGRM